MYIQSFSKMVQEFINVLLNADIAQYFTDLHCQDNTLK